ncbi:hypothetical protein D3C75_1364850 [compost metagenome]
MTVYITAGIRINIIHWRLIRNDKNLYRIRRIALRIIYRIIAGYIILISGSCHNADVFNAGCY